MIAEHIPTITLVISLIVAVKEMRKGSSENEARLIGTAFGLLDRLQSRIDDVEAENEWLKKGVAILIKQLQEHDIVPLWTTDSPQAQEEGKKHEKKWGF